MWSNLKASLMVLLLPIPRVWVMKFATRAVRVGAMGMDRNRDGWVDGRIAGWIERVGDSVKILTKQFACQTIKCLIV